MSDWMDAEAHADRAFEMFERGRWAEAEAELRKALSLNPDQAEWHFNLGLTLEHAGRDSDALICYERAIDLLPEQPDPLMAAGTVAVRLGQFERALKWLNRALTIEPEFEDAYASKIEALIRLGQHDEAETTFYLAQQTLTEPSARCLSIVAESLMHRGQHERAEWCLKEALRLEPNLPRLRARLANLYASTDRPQRALQLYLRELRDDPGSIETLLDFGSLLQETGRTPEAAEKFRRVLELEPANVVAHYRLGQIALAAHRYEQACLEFELVLKLDGQFPGIHSALGEAMLRRGRIEEAREHLLEDFAALRVALDEASEISLPAAGESAERSGQSSPAEINPAAETYMAQELARIADLLLQIDEPARAAELLRYSVELRDDVSTLRQLALAYFRSGDLLAGATVSRRVLRRDPKCVRSIHNLALAALQQNQLTAAWGWIKKGLRINRHDDGLRRLRVRLWLGLATMLWRQSKLAAGSRLATFTRQIAQRVRSISAR